MSERRQRLAAVFLIVGVLVSFAVLAAGLIEALADPPHSQSSLRNAGAILAGLLRAEPVATMELGLLLLMATPVIRVILLVVEFARSRETVFVWIAAVVLLLLAASVRIAAV